MSTPVLRRDPAALAGRQVDAVIIGAGIHGIILTLQAARRGLSVLLVDREDFGGATSASTLRILHGGLRYLQTLDVPRYRQSVAERAWFLATFPELTRSLPFLLALDGTGPRRPSVFRVALEMNDRASASANRRIPPEHRWGSGRVLDAAATRRELPAFEGASLVGGALWHDGLVLSPSRLHVEALRWAASLGARALNHTEAVSLRHERGRIAGVVLHDRVSDEEWFVATDRVFNCAGPWADALATGWDARAPRLSHPSYAFNLVFQRPLTAEGGFGIRGRHGRNFFLWTAAGQTHVGTSHHSLIELGIGEGPGEVERVLHDRALRANVAEAFFEAFREALPGLDLDGSDLAAIHGGVLPAARAGSAATSERDRIYYHATRGGPAGWVSVSGIKYTTAHAVAERALRTAWGSKLPALRDKERPVSRGLLHFDDLRTAIERHPGDAAALVRLLVDEEGAVELDDLLLRRFEGALRADQVMSAGAWIATTLGWSPARSTRSLDRLRGALDHRMPWSVSNSSRDARAASK